MEALKRKYEYNLISSGYIIIILSMWSVVKVLYLRYLDHVALEKYIGMAYIDRVDIVNLKLVVVLLILGGDLILRTYIGINAIREGKGKTTGIIYIILATIYPFIIIISDVSLIMFPQTHGGIINTLTALIIDLTSCFAMITIIYSALRKRKIQAIIDT